MKILLAAILAAATLSGCVVMPVGPPGAYGYPHYYYGYGYRDRDWR
jgi:hypothetical protein